MLIQWLISISLTAEIIFVSMQGFLLLSKMHLTQQLITRESSEIRFLVGYFRAVLHEATDIVSQSARAELMSVICLRQSPEGLIKTERRVLLSESMASEGFTLAVQEEGRRSEVLTTHLKSFSLKFCVKTNAGINCRPASETQEDAEIVGVEFQNHHRWRFILSKHSGKRLNAWS